MPQTRALVWFRQDLRLHDNEALTEAIQHADEVYPVYIFDERIFKGETRWFGFPKTGKFRAQFIIEAIHDLRQSLRTLGSDLIVRVGKPEEEIFAIAQELGVSWVFCNRERAHEETLVQDKLEEALWTIGQEMRYSRGKMLYYTSDLPFPVGHTPDVFTHFRKEVERFVKVREPLPIPKKEDIKPFQGKLDVGTIPTTEDFGHEPFQMDERAALKFKGGEQAGLDRLDYYLWDTDAAKTYKETRNGLVGGDYSTKFSVWLAHGCLS
ncbi:MAG: deoxyribodipyrimidine photo-lyase, partial [Bacteroidota bacterium]